MLVHFIKLKLAVGEVYKNRVIIIFLFFVSFIYSQENSGVMKKKDINLKKKKIGLVLSGGGAKGFAHIGVLKVLEEENIEIDYITGTSMGSIVGGLYSMGYSAKELEKIVLETDWFYHMKDNPERIEIPLEEKLNKEKYIFEIELDGWDFKLPKGLIDGHKIGLLLNRLTWNANGINDFSELPIPFACVATDIETGECVILNKGNLAEAMRASMAIPSIFTPIEIDGKMLIDGMMVRNYPVEEVKKMGADIVIGVDVGEKLKKKEELNNFADVINQALKFRITDNSNISREQTDILIEPELNNFTGASFDKQKELIEAGEIAARKMIGELKKYSGKNKIKEKLKIEKYVYIKKIKLNGLEKEEEKVYKNMFDFKIPSLLSHKKIEEKIKKIYVLNFFNKINYHIDNDILVINIIKRKNDSFKLGFRYDSETNASLLLNTTVKNIGFNSSKTIFDIKLSENPKLSLNYYVFKGYKTKLGYMLSTSYSGEGVYVYNDKRKEAKYNLDLYTGEFFVGTLFSNSNLFGLGLRLNYLEAIPEVAPKDYPEIKESFSIIIGKIMMDFYNKKYFPKQGSMIDFDMFYGDERIESGGDYIQYLLRMKSTNTLFDRIYFTKSIKMGIQKGDKVPRSQEITLGGDVDGENRISFVGVKKMEYSAKNIIVLSGEFNYEFKKNRFFIIKGEMASISEELDEVFKNKDDFLYGIGSGAGANTLIGPVEVLLNYQKENGTTGSLKIGYDF